MSNRRQELLRRINRILDDVTPLTCDCGSLCDARCCRGGDHDGMWLLPDEDMLLLDADFLTIRENAEGKYAICTGHCDRHQRPIACRMYPYFPMLYRARGNRYTVRTMPDLRALSTCALFGENAPALNPAFKRAVRRVGILMLRDRKLRAWLARMGDYIADIAQMHDMLEP